VAIHSLLRRLRRGRPIVVVSGLPRSGTSMAMKMLEAGGLPVVTDGRRAADGSNPNGYYEFERVKELDKGGDTAWLADARGKAVKIISLLVTHLPESYDYQVIFMRRNLDEIVASQNAMLDARQEARGVADERTRELYETHLRQVDRFLAQRRCFSTLTVDYGDALADPRAQASRINTFLGGSLAVDRMVAVAEPALYRNRSTTSQPASAPRR
jgi:hypothetical protein